MPSVVVTGATGFVGSTLARALLSSGAEVTVLCRPSASRHRLEELKVNWIQGDVTNAATLRGAFAGADWLVHAAGRLGQAGVPEQVYHMLHVEGTRNVLAEAASAGVGRVLYISSPGVLGPIRGEPADETAPPAPSNAYERSKAAAEGVVRQFAAAGLPVIIARPEFLYGPGDTHVLGLFRAVQRGLFFYVGRGRHVCHPTFISDAVAGLIACLEKGQPGEIYHICGPRPVTFRELGQTIAAVLQVRPPWLMAPRPLAWSGAVALEIVGKITGRTPPLSRTGVDFFSQSRRFSTQKAQHALNFTPAVDLAEGIARTVAWYRQEGLL
jgi:dihydroflavonol-4-reductase